MLTKLDNGNYALEISESLLGEILYSIYVMAMEQGECSHEIVEFYEEAAKLTGDDGDVEVVRNTDVSLME